MKMNRLLVVSVLFAGIGFAASAQVFDFTLVNKTGKTIDEICVAPADSDEWGDDVLDVEVLADGKSVHITFNEEYEESLLALDIDKYDLKVVDEDGKDYVWSDLKLETIANIEISLKSDGTGVAKIK